jgi:hypothetical protein
MGFPGDYDLGGNTLIVKDIKTGATAPGSQSNIRQGTAAGSTLTLSRGQHAGKIILLDTLTGSIVTLPAATGTGDRYLFLVTLTNTSNNHIIKVANVTDIMIGSVVVTSSTAATLAGDAATIATADDTITMNGTTTGGAVGTWVELIDTSAGVWTVRGQLAGSGTPAGGEFSATV